MNNDTQTGTLFVKGFTPFAQIPKWVIRHKQLSHGAIRLYANIMTYADNKTRTAFPGREKLADDLGISVATVKRYIKELETAGAMTVTRRRNRKTGNFYANHYILSFEEPNVDISTNSPWVTDDPRRGVTDDPITIPTMLTTPTSFTPPNKNPGHRLHPRTSVQGSEYKPDPVSQQFRRSIERDKMIRHIQYVAQRKIDGANPEEIDDLMGTFVDYCSHVFKTDEHLDHLIYDMNWQPSKNHATKYEAAAWLNQLLYVWQAEIGELTFHPIETAA